MKTSLQQSAVLRQELRMNPRLYQAMDLLYMPVLDLQQHLKQELETNPFLEMAEGEEDAPAQETAEKTETKETEREDDEVNWEEIILDGFRVGGARGGYEEREYYEPVTVQTRDLADHLRDQLQLIELSPRQLFLSEEFIGNIGEDGYLQAALEEIVEGANAVLDERRREREADDDVDDESAAVESYTVSEAEELLRIIQRLDPPGIAARDLRECLLL